uniref:Uncharacterized protein n=1 Tax=Kalanchoe fedtschenkoi TaxID=63787 RepID=A0A7N0T240_KALFE
MAAAAQFQLPSLNAMHWRLFLAIFTLISVCEAAGGRKELSSYWRNVMKDEDMPEAIKGLVVAGDGQELQREFRPRPNLIIYHNGPDHRQKHWRLEDVKGLQQQDSATEPGV